MDSELPQPKELVKTDKFPFPSNGKVYSESVIDYVSHVYSEVVAVPCNAEAAHAFQFPSNGKVDSESSRYSNSDQRVGSVSIPFKRESGFRVKTDKQKLDATQFQFPSNGKVDSERSIYAKHTDDTRWFQFPSNGKVDSELSL